MYVWTFYPKNAIIWVFELMIVQDKKSRKSLFYMIYRTTGCTEKISKKYFVANQSVKPIAAQSINMTSKTVMSNVEVTWAGVMNTSKFSLKTFTKARRENKSFLAFGGTLIRRQVYQLVAVYSVRTQHIVVEF